MARQRSIAVYLYSLNARSRGEIIAYQDFFAGLADLAPADTMQALSQELTFAVDINRLEDWMDTDDEGSADDSEALDDDGQKVFVGHVIAGAPGDVPLFFDYTTGQTESGTTPEGKWLATVARLVVSISPTSRYIAIEGGRNGVTAARMARYFALLAERNNGLPYVEFDIVPVQSESLRAEIESFVRIKQASAIVTRPNFDWNDFDDKLSSLAEESAGHEAEAVIKAGRGNTLAKNRGIVGTILGSLNNTAPAIRRFKVTGRKPNSDRDTVVTSENHHQRTFAKVARGASSGDMDSAVYESGLGMINERVNETTEPVTNYAGSEADASSTVGGDDNEGS